MDDCNAITIQDITKMNKKNMALVGWWKQQLIFRGLIPKRVRKYISKYQSRVWGDQMRPAPSAFSFLMNEFLMNEFMTFFLNIFFLCRNYLLHNEDNLISYVLTNV